MGKIKEGYKSFNESFKKIVKYTKKGAIAGLASGYLLAQLFTAYPSAINATKNIKEGELDKIETSYKQAHPAAPLKNIAEKITFGLYNARANAPQSRSEYESWKKLSENLMAVKKEIRYLDQKKEEFERAGGLKRIQMIAKDYSALNLRKYIDLAPEIVEIKPGKGINPIPSVSYEPLKTTAKKTIEGGIAGGAGGAGLAIYSLLKRRKKEKKEETPEKKNLETALAMSMLASSIGLLYEFISRKPIILAQGAQQLAPIMPNYGIYALFLILFGGISYFLVQRMKK
jgi:hypothetical protein